MAESSLIKQWAGRWSTLTAYRIDSSFVESSKTNYHHKPYELCEYYEPCKFYFYRFFQEQDIELLVCFVLKTDTPWCQCGREIAFTALSHLYSSSQRSKCVLLQSSCLYCIKIHGFNLWDSGWDQDISSLDLSGKRWLPCYLDSFSSVFNIDELLIWETIGSNYVNLSLILHTHVCCHSLGHLANFG